MFKTFLLSAVFASLAIGSSSAATCGASPGTDLAANVANINAGPCVKQAVATETANAPLYAFLDDPITGRMRDNSGNNSGGGEGGGKK